MSDSASFRVSALYTSGDTTDDRIYARYGNGGWLWKSVQGGVGTAEKPCFNGQEILTMYIEGTGCAPTFLPPVL